MSGMPIHEVSCPYCKSPVVIESLLDHIFIARRTWPECNREFLIENGKAHREQETIAKRSHTA
jgi:hypothetical protein